MVVSKNKKERQEAKNAILLKSADKGELKKLLMAIKAGANVNARDDDGKTALIKAAEKGYKEIMKLLLKSLFDCLHLL